MGSITLQKVEKWFGDLQVIKGVDLDIADGEFVIFVGPSGCGKSTLLRLICGLEEASRGTILIDGDDVTAKLPSERRLAMVFQSYALYPHMTVGENMGFGLKTAGAPKAQIRRKVAEAARILKLEDHLDRKPKALSGGQRQRVAIGRAITREPAGFLFDEPLSNLDAALRVEMRFEIARLHETLGTTMIYVTHDQVEAMTLADKIVVLDSGVVRQVGTPRDLYERPDDLFVAQFIGSPKMNILDCTTGGGSFDLGGHGSGPFDRAGGAAAVRLGIRPEHIDVVEAGRGTVSGRIEVAEYLGADTFLYVQCDGVGRIVARIAGASTDLRGKDVGLAFQPDHLHFFDGDDRAV